ncbi:MAG: DUF935 domain-containing protein [Polaromonas sp.]
MAILDQFGKPLERAALQEPQTAHVAHLASEFENHPSRGLTPPRLARILQDAEQGDLIAQHELFQDMEEKDAHLYSCMQTRRLALQGLDWAVVPPKNASAAEKCQASFVEEVLAGIQDFEDLIFDMTDGIGHGFAALELTWQNTEGLLLPTNATHRPQSWFKTPYGNRNTIRLRDNSADGAALVPFGWVLHQHRARSGYIARSGLFRILAWPFLFKNFAVRDLAEFLEIYGLPMRLGTYNPAASKEDKATLLRAVVNIGHDAAAIIPAGMQIDFMEAAKGDNKSFDAMISLMERSMSKAILGGTLTSGEGQNGTQALGNVHNELRHDLRNADAKQLSATLKRHLIYPILAVNKGATYLGRCPSIVFDTEDPEDLKLYSDAMPKMVAIGMRVPVSWAHSKLKIPAAAEGEAVLVVPRPEDTLPLAERARPAKPAAALLKAQPLAGTETDELDGLMTSMLGDWEEVMDDTLAPIQQALASASSLEEFRDGLESTLAQLDPQRLAEVLARGQFAARAWGQLNQVKK